MSINIGIIQCILTCQKQFLKKKRVGPLNKDNIPNKIKKGIWDSIQNFLFYSNNCSKFFLQTVNINIMLKEHTESSAFSACYLGKAATSQSLILGVLKGMDSTESWESRLPSDFLLTKRKGYSSCTPPWATSTRWLRPSSSTAAKKESYLVRAPTVLLYTASVTFRKAVVQASHTHTRTDTCDSHTSPS